MNKVSKNEKGFSAIEAIIIIVVLLVIVSVGYLVYKNDHKTTPTQSSTSSGQYTGWKAYHDAHFGFSYPSNWQINQSSFGPGPYTTLTSTKSSISSYITTDPIYPSSIENLNLFLFYLPLYPSGCSNAVNACTVKAVVPLKIKDIPYSQLVVYSKNNLTPPCTSAETNCVVANSPDEFEVTSNSGEKVGDTTVPLGVSINGKTYQFTGCIQTGTENSNITEQECATINNLSAFEASSDYKNLISVLNSLTIN